MGGQCYQCREARLSALTLHHRDPADRSNPNNMGSFSTLWGHKISVTTWAEVWLCDLLCHNCHQVLHGDDKTCWDPVALSLPNW
jgi:hypothetical protein